jgi:hypothetical protein
MTDTTGHGSNARSGRLQNASAMLAFRLVAVLLALVMLPWAMPAQAVLPDATRFGIVIELGDTGAATRWLDEGLDPNFEADRIGTGLMIGAWEGNIAMMELFHSRGADINFTNRIGEQALQLAAWNGRLEAVKWLIERGASAVRGEKQWSALHYAAFAGHRQIADLLLERGADINARTPNGSTALMMAVREGREELVRVLLAAGADARPENDWGDNALTWAMRYGQLRIAKLVVPPEEFAQAVQAPPESFGEPTRSEPAPPELTEILHQLRLAQAESRPVEELRKALFDAVARIKAENPPVAVSGKAAGKTGAPKALVITAKRKASGRERAELVYDQAKADAPPRTHSPDVADILHQLRRAQAEGQPVDELRAALLEAVERLQKEAPRARARRAK